MLSFWFATAAKTSLFSALVKRFASRDSHDGRANCRKKP
jgi:hypothetical protein